MNTTNFYRKLKFYRPILAGLAVATLIATRGDAEENSAKTRQLWFYHTRLVCVGNTAPRDGESQELAAILAGTAGRKNAAETAHKLEAFIQAHPKSPWRASIENGLANYYKETGYFSLALANWSDAWTASKDCKGEPDRMVADLALVRQLQLLASLGRTKTMQQLIDESSGRAMSPGLRSDYIRLTAAVRHMLKHPEDSYRCGTFALSAVGKALTGSNYFPAFSRLKSPSGGFSMAQLSQIAQSNEMDLVPMERVAGKQLPVPSVVHWKEDHYAAILQRKGNLFRVADPTFMLDRWLSADAINYEASGQFLTPSTNDLPGWRTMTLAEAGRVFGKGWPEGWDFPPGPPCTNTCGCPPGNNNNNNNNNNNGCSSCGSQVQHAMPNWTVTEPDIGVWISDKPLAYQTATGGEMAFRIYCHEDASEEYYQSGTEDILGIFAYYWGGSWISYIEPIDGGEAYLYSPGGGIRTYTNTTGTVSEYYSNSRMLDVTNSSGDLIEVDVFYPSGEKDVYGLAVPNSPTIYLLTKQIDPQGRQTTYVYNDYSTDAEDTNYLLVQYVIDCDGRTNTFTYTNNPDGYGSNILTQITDPFNRSVYFSYDMTTMALTNITDPQGYSTSFADVEYGFPTNMTTPYGTTSFDFGLVPTTNGDDVYYQFCIVTQPDGGRQMYLYVVGVDFTGVPEVYTDTNNVPTVRPPNTTLDNPDWNNPAANDYMNYANSFYWNRQQFFNLPSAFLTSLSNPDDSTWNFDALSSVDYGNGRMRHWNRWEGSGLGFSLSMERLPSPDGATQGKMTWWDYPGKPDYNDQGTSAFPSLVIQVLPDGTEWYQSMQMDQWGNITNIASTYSSNGVVALRTNSYVYSSPPYPTNAEDLIQIIGPDGVTQMSSGYNAFHQILLFTNAVGYVTTNTYNGFQQLTSTMGPTGLITTNIYDTNNRLAMTFQYGGGAFFGTNSYTYTNDVILTHTDPRNLVVTDSWDNLERLTNVAYPDGSVSYVYSNLDVVTIKDRMGFTTSMAYDPIRRLISRTDNNGHTTYYGYCECGGEEWITNALQQVTHIVRDNQGNPIEILYPDGSDVYNTFNSIQQLTVRTEGANVSSTNYFNNQGIRYAVSNAAGAVLLHTYDIDDRVISTTDKNGVVVNMAYDTLGRMISRSYPDDGIEKFGYGPTGLSADTNQLGNITRYGYDPARRKVAETNALNNVTQYAYDPASDLITLTDQKGNATHWAYDAYGRVTNKVDATGTTILSYLYDADNRLTNRWSAAKGITGYSYDAVGNLTGVSYPVSHSLSFGYDALNRMTSMGDAIGTTSFAYTPTGQLASETGPWSSDTVFYTYVNRLRTRLSLQQPNASSWNQSYNYDVANRIDSITSPAGTFDYTYNSGLAGLTTSSSLVSYQTVPNGAFITNTYDANGRMTGTYLYNSSASALDSYAYTYDQGNERTQVVRTGENSAGYEYDKIGEVVQDTAFESAFGTPRMNEQIGYAYDAAGNLTQRKNNLIVNPYSLVQAFQVNSLNELTTNTNGGTLTVIGTTTTPASSVIVNGTNYANLYGDGTFGAPLMPLLPTYTATATDSLGRHATNTINVNLATNVTFQYDANGNLTNDGMRNFVYDDENELIQVSVSNQWLSQYQYDGKMRRRIRQEYSWNGSGWTETNEVHYVYDGNLVIQERDQYNLPRVTYTRGKDLSGSLEGVGGIGGLLARTAQSYGDASLGGQSFYHSDANGNVTMLTDSKQGIVAKYLYDAFGNTLSKSGLLADANLYRFSSKEWQPNAGLIYYLFRAYDPKLQRWLNRDPWGERYGINLYDIVANDPLDLYDHSGRDASSQCANGCMNQYFNCLTSLTTPAKGAAGSLIVCLAKGAKATAGSVGLSVAVGEGLNVVDCASTAFGCLAGCPSPTPYPSAPWGSGCSICPVNAPPVIYN